MSNPSLARDVPTVQGRRLFGSVLEFLDRPVGFLVDAYHRHGPVFRVTFPTSHITFIGGTLARDILLSPPACPMSREGLFRPFATQVGVEVFDTEGEVHERGRALLKLPYSRQITSELVPEMQAAMAEVIDAWSPGDALDLFKVACDLAQRAMMAVVTPIDLRDYAADFVKAGNQVMYAQFGLLPELSLYEPAYMRSHRRMIDIINDSIERHRAGDRARDGKVYMIDACLRASNAAGDAMDGRTIRGACFYALAGTEIYVGRLVCFLLYELLRNRHYMDSVLDEVDSAFRGDDLAGALRRMRHLRAAYTETLRVYPLIPGYSYVTKSDMVLGGFRIGKGEPITFAPYLAHFSAEHYANPMAFDPARHLRPGREPYNAAALTPFGAGSHACGAAGMVETVSLTVAAAVLRSMTLSLDNPAYEMSLRLSPLITPKKPIGLRVEGRRAQGRAGSSVSALAESPDYNDSLKRGARAEGGALPAKDPETVAPGTWILQGGAGANACFVVLEGKVSIWTSDGGEGSHRHSSDVEAGGLFADTFLLTSSPGGIRARAESEVKVLRFSSAELLLFFGEHDLTARDLCSLYYGQYIKAALRSSLAGVGKAFTPDKMTWAFFEEGALVFRQGDVSDAFYIIVDGIARVFAETESGDRDIAHLGPGEFFGEIGLLSSRPRGASVRAATALKALCIKRDVFLETIAQSSEALSDLALTVCQRLVSKVRADAGDRPGAGDS